MNVVSTSTKPVIVAEITMSITALEKKLDLAVEQRESAQAQIKKVQDDLERLFNKGPKRQFETVAELDAKLAKLERNRTIVSMPLAQEREILKQISKVERQKRAVMEFLSYDQTIQDKKASVTELRDTVKTLTTRITEMRDELSTLKIAHKLGCRVEDLLGMKVDCPADKLGKVIGKGGKNVKQLMDKQNVTVDIVKKDGDVRIIGSLSSLDSAAADLEKVISKEEIVHELSADLLMYLTSKSISALSEIRQRHPDVYFDVLRNNTKVNIRGVPDDIERLKRDFALINITKRDLTVKDQESSSIVGKQGSTIDRLVETYQAAINVERNKDEGESVISVLGPASNVHSAFEEIEELLADNRETEEAFSIDKNAKGALLLNGGAGIQLIHKKVNEELKSGNGNYVGVNFASDDKVVIKGKTKDVRVARRVLQREIDGVESMIVKIPVDPAVIPAIIGKGGQGIKKLKDGRAVNVELDRTIGLVVICGLDKSEVDSVVQVLKEITTEHQVKRIEVDKATYKAQIREFLRTKAKEVNALVMLSSDDVNHQLCLRGNEDSLVKAVAIVDEFFESHYTEEVEVASEEIEALLSGGKQSKIVGISQECDVKLNSDRERNVFVASGTKENVAKARKSLYRFLHGGEGVVVSKFSLDEQLLGVVIGKGGKTKAGLQTKYDAVSIIIHRNEGTVTLRGPEADVDHCRIEMIKLVANSRVTKTIPVTSKQQQNMENSRIGRRINSVVPVNFAIENDNVVLRGLSPDVQYAECLVKEQLNDVYESFFEFDPSLFRRVRDACRDPSHLKRIEKSSGGARVALETDANRIIFMGSRGKVKKAKIQALSFLEFLLDKCYSRLDLSRAALSSVGKASYLAEVSALSGTTIFLDRDIDAVLVFGSDSIKVEKAMGILQSRLNEEAQLSFVIQLAAEEDWIVSLIIGKNGNKVRGLRKDTECNIDVDSKERRITVNGDTEEKTAKARAAFQEIIDAERKKVTLIPICADDLPAFVGRGGGNISDLQKAHKVEIKVSKTGPSVIRVSGEESAIASAKVAILEWLTSRESTRKSAKASESIRVKPDQIPAVIGTKGAVIRSLEKEFDCKIDIDRKESTVSVTGGSAELRLAAVKKIKEIAAGESGDAVSDDGETGTNAPRVRSSSSESLSIQESKPKVPRAKQLPPTDTATHFPALPSKDAVAIAEEKKDDSLLTPPLDAVMNGPSWASIVSVHPSLDYYLLEPDDNDGFADIPSDPHLRNVFEEAKKGLRSLDNKLSEDPWDEDTESSDDDGLSEELDPLGDISAEVKAALDVANAGPSALADIANQCQAFIAVSFLRKIAIFVFRLIVISLGLSIAS